MTDISKVTVLGTGVLGSQIAFQTAYSGFDVVAYDIGEEALAQARLRLTGLVETYRKEVAGAAGGKADDALKRISLSSDLAASVADADLVIEAVPKCWRSSRRSTGSWRSSHRPGPSSPPIARHCSQRTKTFTGRPDRFLALHFATSIWKFNTAEVMGTPDTDPSVFEAVQVRVGDRHGAHPGPQGEGGLCPQFAARAAPERGRRSCRRRLCRSA
jgi:3-hydroxybutyryl-CoA dehydrogenase